MYVIHNELGGREDLKENSSLSMVKHLTDVSIILKILVMILKDFLVSVDVNFLG